MSSETYNKLHIQYHKVGVARFPNVAFLQCCASNYDSATTNRRNMRCFAKFCHTVACPRSALRSPLCSDSDSRLSFKYNDEGRSATMHATALSLPGARYAAAADATPPRLHIEVPRPGEGAAGVLYTCKTCETADVVDPVSLNVTACLFRRREYGVVTLDEARKKHSCRYFDMRTLKAVCSALAPEERMRTDYPWWCGDAAAAIVAKG
mmetsp:Transcript_34869/g.102269  ORF Transcript_34869/g.102269 Transcript_34869/m.102269 type:complete len:208 (-) Transcript_34869:79-702(-)